jgi:hypothetical protein
LDNVGTNALNLRKPYSANEEFSTPRLDVPVGELDTTPRIQPFYMKTATLSPLPFDAKTTTLRFWDSAIHTITTGLLAEAETPPDTKTLDIELPSYSLEDMVGFSSGHVEL